MEEAKKSFINYVKKYNMKDNNIKKKYKHSFRVMELANKIAKELKLSNENIYLASLIGLIHDLGRFDQIKKYNTFYDHKSIDHGKHAVDILKEKDFIKEFTKDINNYNIIYKAIENHNQIKIDKNLKDWELLHAKIIRDADKTDILHYFFTVENMGLESTDQPISNQAREEFYSQKLIKNETITNLNEEILAYLCYIYDLNFDYSLKYIVDNKYLDIIYESINNKEIFDEYFNFIKEYIKERLR